METKSFNKDEFQGSVEDESNKTTTRLVRLGFISSNKKSGWKTKNVRSKEMKSLTPVTIGEEKGNIQIVWEFGVCSQSRALWSEIKILIYVFFLFESLCFLRHPQRGVLREYL